MTELPSNLRTFLTALRPFVKFDRVEIVNADIHRLLELETAKEDESCAFMLDSLISLVIANLISNAWREQISHMAMTMMDIDEYIRKNVAQNISPVMLSKRVGLSVNYFRVLFTDFFGMTPGKYINKIKMNEAARMLGETLLPIKTIARKVGFVQPSNFHRSFVQFHKTTPRKFRKFTVHLF